ncbi:response regulator [Alteromonas sp. KUL49]|uniref:response regulator n=1 Tax=Alteromonas sp. KUL49 TaxID=2480798 RepID=UPI00102EEB62|nr:response regulator [Alteromonas sp. KUL49]TAP38581.1 response regulator [Alteromonas sp. KUL49]GEA12514.1 diguanylate cyclase [Alteromonas sp. KUL49]
MQKVLVIEDSSTVRKVLTKLIGDNPNLHCVACANLAEAKEQIAKDKDFLVAIADLNLPDAPNGESVELMLSHEIPTIVLTGNFDENLRTSLLNKGVIDYITKESRYSYTQVVNLADRLRKNLTTKVLVVEDSKTTSAYICNLLKKFHFQVISTTDGLEALDQLKQHPDVKLVISDYLMPNMDGCELIKAIRQNRNLQDLVFIGLSAAGDSVLSAKFIKSGANDFLTKPFYHEEFFCRVLKNLESQEMIETIRKSAYLDPLTHIYNRRFLFEEGERIQRTHSTSDNFMVAMFDVDNFKSVNDTYGHKIGDHVLQEMAAIMQQKFPNDLVARYGGEEFTVLSTRDESAFYDDLILFMEKVRTTPFTQEQLALTCSVGVSGESADQLDHIIDTADKHLYTAKNTGKDRVIFNGEED